MISDNIKRIRDDIEETRHRCGAGSVKLLAVTKGVPVEKIREAVESGQRLFGENYLKEALVKMDGLKGGNLEWHFIGALQSNKAGRCAERFSVIESVDRESLAVELDRKLSIRGVRAYPVFIEVNIAGERSKSGVTPDKIRGLLEKVSNMHTLKIKGLMCIPPVTENPQESRPFFSSLRKLADEINGLRMENIFIEELSMGMSHDYKIAIEEGATMVRIGTAIFGERA